MRPVRTHKFSSGTYKISRHTLDGLCLFPDHLIDQPPDFEIWIHPDLRGQQELETWIHESIHAEFPEMSEKHVRAAGHNIARLLWRIGYRKRKDSPI